jgi:hypothetical protein
MSLLIILHSLGKDFMDYTLKWKEPLANIRFWNIYMATGKSNEFAHVARSYCTEITLKKIAVDSSLQFRVVPVPLDFGL